MISVNFRVLQTSVAVRTAGCRKGQWRNKAPKAFSCPDFGAPKIGPKPLSNCQGAILTLPCSRKATQRPTVADTGLYLYLWSRPRLLLKLSGEIVQAHASLLLAVLLHLSPQDFLLSGVEVVAPVFFCAIYLAEIQLQCITGLVLRNVIVGIDVKPVIILIRAVPNSSSPGVVL